jgi:hypothetical protein
LLIFALLAAAAPLVKGNGALIALVPAIHIVLTGRWRLLRLSALWAAAALTLVLVAPWYWISFRISAGGFNYAPGLAYAGLALGTNALVIFLNIGGGGLLLAGFGLLPPRRPAPEQGRIKRLAIAVVLATLIFQSIVPAAIEPRYIMPALPWLIVLAGLGLLGLVRAGPIAQLLAILLVTLALMPTALSLSVLAPKPDLGAPALAETMAKHGGVWLGDGRAGGEGALIAAGAWADRGAHRLWVSRASQWLSSSDFMGRDYVLTAKTPDAARAVLDRLGVAGVVSIAERNDYAYPHSRVLDAALHGGGYDLTQQRFAAGDGSVLTARRIAPVTPNVALIEQNSGSANVAKIGGELR